MLITQVEWSIYTCQVDSRTTKPKSHGMAKVLGRRASDVYSAGTAIIMIGMPELFKELN